MEAPHHRFENACPEPDSSPLTRPRLRGKQKSNHEGIRLRFGTGLAAGGSCDSTSGPRITRIFRNAAPTRPAAWAETFARQPGLFEAVATVLCHILSIVAGCDDHGGYDPV